jgi:hypothetical protein
MVQNLWFRLEMGLLLPLLDFNCILKVQLGPNDPKTFSENRNTQGNPEEIINQLVKQQNL